MRRRVVQSLIVFLALLVVGYPQSVWYANATFTSDTTLLVTLFPTFGLFAMTIMYLHIIGRPFKALLAPYVSFDRFERGSSYLVLVSIILHPLLRTVFFVVHGLSLIPPPAYALPIMLGIAGFLLLIIYDLGKLFAQNSWVMRHGTTIDVLSTLGFYVVWIHAFMLGGELQAGPLRSVWLFYGASALLASLWVFVRARNGLTSV